MTAEASKGVVWWGTGVCLPKTRVPGLCDDNAAFLAFRGPEARGEMPSDLAVIALTWQPRCSPGEESGGTWETPCTGKVTLDSSLKVGRR